MDTNAFKSIIPAAVATAAGIGLDLSANTLSGWWSNAPYALYAFIFWIGIFLTAVPFSTWLIWKFLTSAQRNNYWSLLCLAPLIMLGVFAGAVELASSNNQRLDVEKKEAARRWISLSQDMFFDLPSLRPDFDLPFDHSMSQELQQQLWKAEADRNRRAANTAINRMKQKYEARVEQARLEMVKFGVGQSDYLETHSLYNTGNLLIWEEWAKRLGAEGHRVLGD